MSREILFKAKRKNWKELPEERWWVEGYPSPCVVVGKWHICRIEDNLSTTQIEVDPETICQYTGLTDKNGKRIWENDIVSNKWCFVRGNSIVRYGEYKDWHMTEKYQCGNLGFYLDHIDKKDSTYIRKDMIYFAGNCKVEGNIFDNPELL